jgi:alkanesulfonate monooxygenase SsuD/methylene tetrahydromethanopterin reductase-like flavin-dependent oxidoreductase (luciferase family)
MGRLGLMLKGQHMSIQGMIEFSVQAEERGFESVWIPEFWRECFVPAAAIAMRTSRIQIGVGIALGYARSATLMAQTVANIDEVSQGRFIFGLGTGAFEPNELWYDVRNQKRPLTRIRDVAEIVRRVLTAHQDEQVSYEGKEASMKDFPVAFTPHRPRVPLYLGSIKPRSIELAGAIADGVLTGALISVQYLREVVRPRLHAGATGAGRSARDVDLASLVTCAIADDPAEARAMARADVATYLPFEGMRTVFDQSDYGEIQKEAAAAFLRNDIDAVRAAVTDDMIDTLTVCGTPDQCRAKLEALREYVELPVLLPAAAGLSPAEVHRNTARILETFAPQLAHSAPAPELKGAFT